MPQGMVVDVAAVAGLASLQRSAAAGLTAADPRGVGLADGELAGSRTAAALARGLDAIADALTDVGKAVEELGRRTAWGATAVDVIDRAAADDLERSAG